MPKRTTAERLALLKDREHQLIQQRKAVEARLAAELARASTRARLTVADAVLAWMAADSMAFEILPKKLRPHVPADKWPAAENLLSRRAK